MVIAQVTRPGGGTMTVPMQWGGERGGQYRGTFVTTEPGAYEVSVDATRAGKSAGAGSRFVRAAPADSEYLRPDDARRAAAAYRGGDRRPVLYG